jgi:hypothetical protein
MRGWVAEERRGPAHWQQSTSAPALSRVWGVGAEIYGVGTSGVHRSTDGGATWMQVGDPGAAIGVWGSGLDDVWVVRARTLHHSTDGEGEHWTTRTLPVSFGTTLEGMVLSCEGANVALKAYLAACRARWFPEAKALFVELGKTSLAQICVKEGFDPRKP